MASDAEGSVDSYAARRALRAAQPAFKCGPTAPSRPSLFADGFESFVLLTTLNRSVLSFSLATFCNNTFTGGRRIGRPVLENTDSTMHDAITCPTSTVRKVQFGY
jgi:hypothetical protein